MRGLSCAAIARAFSKRAACLEVGGDAGRTEGVAADVDLQAGVGRSTLDHAPDIDAMHWYAGENARLADCRAE